MKVDEYVKITKIATAFIAVNDCINPLSLGRIKKFYEFLKNRPDIVSLLGFVHIVSDHAATRILPLVKHCALASSDRNLLNFLINAGDSVLVVPVLYKIITTIEHELGFVRLDVSTSHELTETDRTNIENFLERKMKAKIIPNYSVNKDLMCGIRVKGERLVWEYSLAQRLGALITQPTTILE
jgi:F0F1-type ATP synthase delta subunit